MTGGIGSRTDYSLARRKTEAEVDRATGLRRQMASRSRTAARNNPQAGFLKCERDRQGEISDLHVNGGERRGHFSRDLHTLEINGGVRTSYGRPRVSSFIRGD